MSESDERTRLVATAEGATPEDALRLALAEIGRQLGRIGGGPTRLAGMVWTTSDPGAVHPSRRAIDLAYREAFGGIRPPIRLRRGEGPGVAVEAEVAPPVASPSGPAWGSFGAAELGREYSPRGQVADMSEVLARWSRDGEAFRRSHGALDLAYGPGSAEQLDLYRPAGAARPPVWVFIHGGYWQATTRAQHAHFAAGMLRAGFAVANLDYALAPDADLAAMVDQVGAALRFLMREADALDVDGDALHVAGHSAGAHLAAMAALDDAGPHIRSALLLSGLFDLAPVAALPVGPLLGLASDGIVKALSPFRRRRPAGLRVGVAVGGRESGEFKRQSREMAEAWGAAPPLVVEGANHFDLLDGLIEGELLALAVRIAREPVDDDT